MSDGESWPILHNDWCISKKSFAIASFVWLDTMLSRATIVSVPLITKWQQAEFFWAHHYFIFSFNTQVRRTSIRQTGT
jgi:hypothetical protein